MRQRPDSLKWASRKRDLLMGKNNKYNFYNK